MPRHVLAVLGIALGSAALYVGLVIRRLGYFAYPLDDAWIHLTFARNLATHGELSYSPGTLSAGSTSPLWTALLAPGFWLPFDPFIWNVCLGLLALISSAWLAGQIASRAFSEAPALAAIVPIVFVLEWHLVWAAFSGMETLLFIALLLLLVDAYQRQRAPFALGLVGGLILATRPEGVFLLASVAALVAAERFRGGGWRAALLAAFWFAVGFILLALPYFAFNWIAGGSLLPNTFNAKAAEYASLLDSPLWTRLGAVGSVPFVGAQALLLPGFVVGLWLALRERRVVPLVLLAWWLADTVAYAVRLPVIYQHGRYEMPVLPVLLLVGLWGSWRLSHWLLAHSGLLARVMSRAWKIAFVFLLLVFWLRGGIAFATDANVMDCIGVRTARWLAANTTPGDRLAVHDIGAVGYMLPGRSLVDLAGLISPAVIGFIRDEPRLLAYIIDQDAAYLVTSDAWHARMLSDPRVRLVFRSDCPVAREEGGYEIGVYRVSR